MMSGSLASGIDSEGDVNCWVFFCRLFGNQLVVSWSDTLEGVLVFNRISANGNYQGKLQKVPTLCLKFWIQAVHRLCCTMLWRLDSDIYSVESFRF